MRHPHHRAPAAESVVILALVALASVAVLALVLVGLLITQPVPTLAACGLVVASIGLTTSRTPR